jgi:N-methylhydantoinase A/oxoprolinase/acetone carboxylase beta subunit
MIGEGARQLVRSGVRKDHVEVEIAADVRHRGQGDALTVELGAGLNEDPERQVEEAFDEAYVHLYGRRPPGVESEVMTWRVRVSGPAPELDVRVKPRARRGAVARKVPRRAWFAETGFVSVDVLDRYLLQPGTQVGGPAVVEETESTVVIGPSARGKVDSSGSLVVEIA